eukprot:6548018-Ditylum_brightwellii.AAC.1
MTSDMMACDVTPESKSAKDDDKSSTESSVDDIWKGYTMWRITNDYADEHQEVLSFHGEIEEAVLE